MEAIRELFFSVYRNFSERLTNPFIGAFLIAFLVCNWRALFIFLWGVKNIETVIFQMKSHSDLHSLLLYPIAFALFYVALFPWVAYVLQMTQEVPNKLRHKAQADAQTARLDDKIGVAKKEIELEKVREYTDLKEKQNQLEEIKKKLLQNFETLKSDVEQTRSQAQAASSGWENRTKTLDGMERNWTSKEKNLDAKLKQIESQLKTYQNIATSNDKTAEQMQEQLARLQGTNPVLPEIELRILVATARRGPGVASSQELAKDLNTDTRMVEYYASQLVGRRFLELINGVYHVSNGGRDFLRLTKFTFPETESNL